MMLATETKQKDKLFDKERIKKALDSKFTSVNKKLSKKEIKALILSRA